jgi:hypothetical protein
VVLPLAGVVLLVLLLLVPPHSARQTCPRQGCLLLLLLLLLELLALLRAHPSQPGGLGRLQQRVVQPQLLLQAHHPCSAGPP